MPDESDHALDLIIGRLRNTLNTEEDKELNEWIESSVDNRLFYEKVTNAEQLKYAAQRYGEADGKPVWDLLRQQIPGLPETFEPSVTRRIPLMRWVAAAAIVLVIGTIISLMTDSQRRATNEKSKTVLNDQLDAADRKVMMDSSKITLFHDGGSFIYLEHVPDGLLVQEDGAKVVKDKNEITFKVSATDASFAVNTRYYTLYTPPGQTYRAELPDGTKIWLSVGSSIRFPLPFINKVRKVELTGEGYFIVAPIKNVPFLVSAKETVTQVLGTSFNLRAYPSEPEVTTTVIHGTVIVKSEKDSALLSIGKQATLTSGKKWVITNIANPENAARWRKGHLEFNEAPIAKVLSSVAEWYAYRLNWDTGVSTSQKMTGSLNIKDSISNIAKALESTFYVNIKVDTLNRTLNISQ